jgi:hypothetical protein
LIKVNFQEAFDDGKDSNKIFSSAAFQESNENLLKLLTNDPKFESIVYAKRWPLSGDYPPQSTLEEFKHQLEKINQDQRAKQTARSIHPNLPVAVYFSKKTPDYQMVRILQNTPNKSVVRFDAMYNKFWKLVLATTYIHLKVSEKTKMTKAEYQQSRDRLFQWIQHMILKENDNPGIPLIGLLKNDRNQAPWEDQDGKEHKSFQIDDAILIQYLSNEVNSGSLKKASTFLYTHWNQIEYRTSGNGFQHKKSKTNSN